jgi:hypothetical protein
MVSCLEKQFLVSSTLIQEPEPNVKKKKKNFKKRSLKRTINQSYSFTIV